MKQITLSILLFIASVDLAFSQLDKDALIKVAEEKLKSNKATI